MTGDLGWPSCLVISRGAEGPGREILQRPPSVRLSVCPSVTFSFRTVTQKRIAVFSRNFAGMCTKSWGCAVFDIDGMLFEFFMNFLNIEKNKILRIFQNFFKILQNFMFSSRFMLFPALKKKKKWCKQKFGGGGGD